MHETGKIRDFQEFHAAKKRFFFYYKTYINRKSCERDGIKEFAGWIYVFML